VCVWRGGFEGQSIGSCLRGTRARVYWRHLENEKKRKECDARSRGDLDATTGNRLLACPVASLFLKLRQVQQVLQGPFLLCKRIAWHRIEIKEVCWNAMASQNVTRLLFSFSIGGEESGIKEARQHTRSCRRHRRRQPFFFLFFFLPVLWGWRCSS
jgi:hypothetical protein